MDILNDRLLAAVGEIDESFLEEFESTDLSRLARQSRRKERLRRSVAVCSLVLSLVLLLTARFPRSIPPVPAYENAYFTAEELISLYASEGEYGVPSIGGAGTVNYQTVIVRGAPTWNIDTVKDLETLAVYSTLPDSFYPTDKAAFESFVARYRGAIESIIRIDSDFEIRERSAYGSDIVEYDTGEKGVSMEVYHTRYIISLDIENLESLYPGELPAISRFASDDEILEALMPYAKFVLSAWGKAYSDLEIARDYASTDSDCSASVSVRFYDKEKAFSHEVDSYMGGKEECLIFSFYENGSEDTEKLMLSHIWYREMTEAKKESLEQVAKLRRLPLSEAEALLQNGCFFSGNVCPFCAAENHKAVDFTKGYDEVSLVYRMSRNGMLIPFYRFYVKTRQDLWSGLREYGYVYVPAVEVSGLSDFFEAKHAGHASS